MIGKKWAVVLAVLVIGSMILAACGPAPTPQVVKETVVVEKVVTKEVEKVVTKEVEKVVEVTPTPVPGEEKVTLNWNLGTEPPTLDPALAEDTTSVACIENLFLGLTDLDPETNEVVPELATEWSVSEDGLVWTFKMRQDAKWVKYNRGTGKVEELGPVTAHDVVYGVKRTLNPKTASGYAYVLYIIKGGEAFNTADPEALSDEEFAALEEGVGVKAVDDYTVEFTLEHPAGYFPAIASMWVARPQPKDAIEAHGERWIEPGFIVTNGPYVLVDWVHEDSMVLEKNPLFYAADEVQIERVELVMVVEASTAMAMYEANQLDDTSPPLEDMDRVKADPVLSKELYIAPRDCTYYYGFTNDKPPMDNKLVRRALSAAIDRQGLIDNVLKGGQLPANTFAPSMIFGNAALDPRIAPWALPESLGGTGYAKAVELAKGWLAEAGYPDAKGFPTITLMYNTSEGHKKIAEAIAAMWKDALGIDVKVENQEWKVYLNTISKKTPVEEMPHVWRLGWCADYPDENNWVKEVFAPSARNDIRWNNQEFQKIVDEAEVSPDPAKRKELYFQAEKILCDDEAAIAPIYYYTTVALTKPWLTRYYGEMGGEHWWKYKIDWAQKKKALGK
jgi:oligopeptide transport system substrate-binding protein